MRDIINAAIAVTRKMLPSITLRLKGVRLEPKPSCTRPPPCNTLRITPMRRLEPNTMAVAIARNISARHPARMPFGPRKMVLGAAGGGSGFGGLRELGTISELDIAHLSTTDLPVDSSHSFSARSLGQRCHLAALRAHVILDGGEAGVRDPKCVEGFDAVARKCM